MGRMKRLAAVAFAATFGLGGPPVTIAHPETLAPYPPAGFTDDVWVQVLRRRAKFIMTDVDGVRSTENVATVKEYLTSAQKAFDETGSMEPPKFHDRAIPVDEFLALLDNYMKWLETQTMPVGLAMTAEGDATTESIDARRLAVPAPTTTPTVPTPQPETTTATSTAEVPAPTTTPGIIPTTGAAPVIPSYYSSCNWTLVPDPPTCDDGFGENVWNSCVSVHCDASEPVTSLPVCCDGINTSPGCDKYQCDNDSDGIVDCITDSDLDGDVDEFDDLCGLADSDGVGIPNSIVVCPIYETSCVSFKCHCDPTCYNNADCCDDVAENCFACSCSAESNGECCCESGEYNKDCVGEPNYCNCHNCTVEAGKYFASFSLTGDPTGCTTKNCEPAGCSAGEYRDGCEGAAVPNLNDPLPGSCVPCITTCDVGEYMTGTCDGSSIVDVKSCQNCTDLGECPDKFYYEAANCQGDGTTDDSCVACTASGACAVGEFFDATQCLGDGVSDTTCQPCTTTGNCAVGEFYEATNCQGDTTSDDSCVACTTTGNCPIRSFFNAANCQGDTTSDDSCDPCTALGACADNSFWDVSACDGSGTSDDQCSPCTTTGNCPADHYYSDAACDGTSTSDDSCVACTVSGACSAGEYFDAAICAAGTGTIDSCAACTTTGNCPNDFYFDTTACDGTGTSDDSCVACTTLGNCPVGDYFDATICATGTSEIDSCVTCSTSCATGSFYDNTKCQGDGTSDDTCVVCSSVLDHCLECSDGTTCDVCDTGYTPMDGSYDGVTLADGTVVSSGTVLGQCIDVDKPVMTNCPPEVYIEADAVTTTYFAHWLSPESFLPLSATDVVDGAITLSCTPINSGDTVGSFASPLDDFNNTCTATDAASNFETCEFEIKIVDSTPPDFDGCPDNQAVTAAYGSSTATATWTEPTAEDAVDGAVSVYSSDLPGDEFSIGNNTVTYYAVDTSGNAAYCRFYIAVLQTDTTTPGIDSGFFVTAEPIDDSSNVVDNVFDNFVGQSTDQDNIQANSDATGMGVIDSSVRTATSVLALVFESHCSDPSDLSVVAGMIEQGIVGTLGLVADSITHTESCAPVDMTTELTITFSGTTVGDGSYSTLEDEIAAEIASTLGLTTAEVTVTRSIATARQLVVEVTSDAGVSDDELTTLLTNINDNTSLGSFNLSPASGIEASEITVSNDMVTDAVLTLTGSYDGVTDYSALESALISTMAEQLSINEADISILNGIDAGGQLELRIVTAGYDTEVSSYSTTAALDAAAITEGFGGVSDVAAHQRVTSEVTLGFGGDMTDGFDYSSLEAEFVTEAVSALGLNAEDVSLEVGVTNNRAILKIISTSGLSESQKFSILTGINQNSDISNTDLDQVSEITLVQISAEEADSRNQIVLTVVGTTYISEQMTLDSIVTHVNENEVVANLENEDGTDVGSVRSSSLTEDNEVFKTQMSFAFDEAYDANADYTTHEFMVLNAIATTLGISIYDIETVSIGDDGGGNLAIVVSFDTTFELQAADSTNIVSAFFSAGVECLSNITTIEDVLAGIELHYVHATSLTDAEKELCIVQYFSSYETNTVTQWQDDNNTVNYYAGVVRTDWAQRLTESKSFKFSTEGRSNVVNSFSLGQIENSNTQLFTVTTVPEGTSYSQLGKNFDDAIKDILLDRYVIAAIELFDGNGAYLHDEVEINFCISSRDTTLTVDVYRLPVGSTEWVEVTNLVKTSSTCYTATTPLCILAFGVVAEDPYVPRYAQGLSASVLYESFGLGTTPNAVASAHLETLPIDATEVDEQFFEYYESRGDARLPITECEAPYFGNDCAKRGCSMSLATNANYFASTLDVLFSPCLSGEEDQGCSHSYMECGGNGVCNYDTGVCNCAQGFTGAGCKYADCPRDEDGVACSAHGKCDLADFVKDGTAKEPQEVALSTATAEWALAKTLQCTCDSGYGGPDCSMRQCTSGIDPLTVCELEVAPDVQDIDVSGLTAASSFTLVFTELGGAEYRSIPVEQTASAEELRDILQRMPNQVVPSVEVSKAGDVFSVTFSDNSNAGKQNLLQCNPDSVKPDCWQDHDLGGNQPLFLYDGTCTVVHNGLPETDSANYEYQVMQECSNRGLCDRATGLCECFTGYEDASCSTISKMV